MHQRARELARASERERERERESEIERERERDGESREANIKGCAENAENKLEREKENKINEPKQLCTSRGSWVQTRQ